MNTAFSLSLLCLIDDIWYQLFLVQHSICPWFHHALYRFCLLIMSSSMSLFWVACLPSLDYSAFCLACLRHFKKAEGSAFSFFWELELHRFWAILLMEHILVGSVTFIYWRPPQARYSFHAYTYILFDLSPIVVSFAYILCHASLSHEFSLEFEQYMRLSGLYFMNNEKKAYNICISPHSVIQRCFMSLGEV